MSFARQSLLGLAVAMFAPMPVHAALSQEGTLVANTLVGGELSGDAVSISDTTAVVGAPSEGTNTGAVYVFVKDGPNWVFQARLTASDGTAGDRFGHSASVSGDDIAIGAPGRSGNSGAVYTFSRVGTVWTQDGINSGSQTAAGDQFGYSVSIQGDTYVAGSPFDDIGSKTDQGSAYVFTKNEGVWSQQQFISDTRGSVRAGDHIGWSVSLSGNTTVIGAPDDDFGNKVNRGSIYIYVRTGTVWTRQSRLNPGGASNDRAGSAVAVFANSLLVGSDGSDVSGKANQGRAFFYTRSGTSWTLRSTLTASDGAANDRFGTSVALAGQLGVVGAPQPSPSTGTGKSYVFGASGLGLAQVETLTATSPTSAEADLFGFSVGLDSGRAAVGAPGADASGVDSGAGYVFGIVQPTNTEITEIDPSPSFVGQSYSVSVEVTSGVGTPTGSVDISDGDGASCQITLDAGTGSCSLASVAPGPHTISASYSGTPVYGASSDTNDHQVNGADLAISKDDGADAVVDGQRVVYTIVVSNPGDIDATGVRVQDTAAAELVNPSWSCTAQTGGTCPNPASGTGNLDQLVDLLADGQVTFLFEADYESLGTLGVDNTATLTAPDGFNDQNPNNDTALDSNTEVDNSIFSDGFEDVIVP